MIGGHNRPLGLHLRAECLNSATSDGMYGLQPRMVAQMCSSSRATALLARLLDLDMFAAILAITHGRQDAVLIARYGGAGTRHITGHLLQMLL